MRSSARPSGTYSSKKLPATSGSIMTKSVEIDLPTPDWERRLLALWNDLDALGDSEFTQRMKRLVEELSPLDPVALFELGAACDSTGLPSEAVSFYERALAKGLSGLRRRRACIQMASSLRNLGNPARAAEILFAERRAPSDELDQAVAAFLALALVDLGREREAVAVSLGALSTYLPRYNRSLARYAEALGVVRAS